MLMNIIIGISRLSSSASTGPGAIRAGTASTGSRLHILDPSTLPMARSGSFLSTLASEAASSGRLVPTATTVSPITRSLTSIARARLTAPQTMTRELTSSSTSPANIQNTAVAVRMSPGMWCASSSLRGSGRWAPAAAPTTTASTAPRLASSKRPSVKSSTRSSSTNQASAITRNIRGNSRRRTSDFTLTGRTSAHTPTTRPMLAMLDPTALPTATPGLPPKAAAVPMSISGAEVPTPTTVSPTTSSGTPRFRAVTEAPSTKRSEPHTSTASPRTMAPIQISSMVYVGAVVSSALQSVGGGLAPGAAC